MYSFSLFPMFWINEWNISRNTFYLMIAMNEYIIWIYIYISCIVGFVRN